MTLTTSMPREPENPACPDCEGEGYTWPTDDPDADGHSRQRCATNGIIDRDLCRHADAPELDDMRMGRIGTKTDPLRIPPAPSTRVP